MAPMASGTKKTKVGVKRVFTLNEKPRKMRKNKTKQQQKNTITLATIIKRGKVNND